MRPVALLTGGTGFLGGRLAQKLARRGFALHALCRAGSDRGALAGLEVTFHDGDLSDGRALERAFAAATRDASRPVVVHAGAVISYRSGEGALQREVNVEGTRRVLDLCRRYPVGRVLHVGSVVAVGPARGEEVLDEDSEYRGDPLHCDYMTTKRRAEELALAAAADLDLVIVDPGAIFGASDRPSNSQRVVRMVATGRTGILPLLLAPPGEQSVVGLEDCAEGCLLALERGSRGRRYLLVESIWSHRDLIALVARRTGRRPPLSVPRPLWRALEAASGLLDGAVRSEFFTPQTIRMARVRFRASGERARRELGWRPRPFEQVIDELVAELGLGAPS
ncbi:MAG: NAD-dependent epimerase/dehydratase family protein [Planctomycetes bacterium]|nr:NAD-dependent epimerase/dehydratase family protein [Planctomycetota bacterium]